MYLLTATTTFNRLLALDRTRIYARSYGTGNAPTKGQPHEVAGNVTVQTTPGQEFSLIAARSQINVTATVTGSGTIRARSSASVYTPPCRVSFSAENTGYDGAVHVYNDVDVITNICGLTIAKEENLGGNPRRFDPDALMLGYGSVFAPAAAVTIDDANRGVTFTSSTNLESQVWTGATLDLANDFTINTPVVFDKGIYVKTNSAMFAWGKGGVTVAEDVTLLVKDGTVKPQGFGALGGMSLSFAEGAAMAFDLPIAAGDSRSVYGVDMRGVTLDNAAEKLSVRVDVDADAVEGGTASAPLATFADAGSAQAFIDGATVSQTCGYKVSLSVVTQTLEDVEVATVSAKAVKVGFAIVIR